MDGEEMVEIIVRTLERWEPDEDECADLEALSGNSELFSAEGTKALRAAIDRYRQEELT